MEIERATAGSLSNHDIRLNFTFVFPSLGLVLRFHQTEGSKNDLRHYWQSVSEAETKRLFPGESYSTTRKFMICSMAFEA